MQIKQKQYFWKVVIAFSIMLFTLNSIIFILLGRVNSDEGWYLYASKLVYANQLPYKDFAFTQTPLLPYIYGIPQLLFQSLYLGRVTSVVFSIIAFILSLMIAKNHSGEMASGIAALLGATFTYGIYAQTTIKTFTLTTFFFILAFFVLSSNSKKNLGVILSVVLVLLATLTRLSAAFFAVPFIVYALVVSDRKNKLLTIALCFAAFFWMLILTTPNLNGAIWGLITYHSAQWGNTSMIERAAKIVNLRIPALLLGYSYYFLLWGVVLFIGFNRIKNNIRHNLAVVITIIGLLLFAIPNISSGGFYIDYFVPFIFTSFPITAIAYTKIFRHEGTYGKTLMNAVLIVTLILGIFLGGFYFIDTTGQRAPVEEIKDVSAIIAKRTTSKDKIFLLQALWIAIEAHRESMPNMTMAQFSFYETDTKTANQLHLINGEITLDYIENSVPKIIALTDLDWDILKTTSYYPQIVSSLEKNYRLIYYGDNFGYDSSHIGIYIRHTEK